MITELNDNTIANRHTTPEAEPGVREGRAVRFLIDHHLGRLMTECPKTGEAHIRPVHYVIDPLTGAFVTHLTAASDQVAAIRAGGRSVLSVPGERGRMGGDPALDADASGDVWHVQAAVDVEVVDDPLSVQHVLRTQITDMMDDLADQADRSDPVDRVGRSVLDGLVGLRMWPTAVWARVR